MGRKSTVEKLPEGQFEFVVLGISNGLTDREISAAFEKQFEAPLPKSSLNSWRNKYGNELAERYRIKRFQARELVEHLKEDGLELPEDKYRVVIENLEDHLLTAERDLIASDPLKLLAARQEDERIRVKREQIALNERKLAFEREKHEREAAVRVDRLAIGAEVWKFILFWLSDNEPHLADGLTRRSSDVLAVIEDHLSEGA